MILIDFRNIQMRIWMTNNYLIKTAKTIKSFKFNNEEYGGISTKLKFATKLFRR